MTAVPDPLHVAIDLGAGSGRALIGGFVRDSLRWNEVHRFHYAPRQHAGHLRWDLGRLLDGMRIGLQRAQARASELGRPLASVGVDSWGVDYALLDHEGRLVEEPICYRDARTHDAVDQVCSRASRDEIYARTGIQFQPFNTLYQLWAHVRDGFPAAAEKLLLIPDYCHYVLCGTLSCERTNASTTQLLAAGTSRWDDDLIARLGLPRHVLPPIVEAGTGLGTLSRELVSQLGAAPLAVVAPGTHDTASAVPGSRGVHFVRHLVPGWRGARSAAAFTRSRPGGPNERGGGRRYDAITHERHGPLAARVLQAGVGSGRTNRGSVFAASSRRTDSIVGRRRLARRPPVLRASEHGRRPAPRALRHWAERHRRPGAAREGHP